MPLLLLVLIGVPIIEIALFIEVGGYIGLWPTLATILATAVVGAALVRTQGLATLAKAQAEVDAGRPPVRELFDGVCILIAGALLLTPGFMTDALGLALLVPGFRTVLGRRLLLLIRARGTTTVHWHTHSSDKRGDGTVVDADFEDVTDKPQRPDDGDGDGAPKLGPRGPDRD